MHSIAAFVDNTLSFVGSKDDQVSAFVDDTFFGSDGDEHMHLVAIFAVFVDNISGQRSFVSGGSEQLLVFYDAFFDSGGDEPLEEEYVYSVAKFAVFVDNVSGQRSFDSDGDKHMTVFVVDVLFDSDGIGNKHMVVFVDDVFFGSAGDEPMTVFVDDISFGSAGNEHELCSVALLPVPLHVPVGDIPGSAVFCLYRAGRRGSLLDGKERSRRGRGAVERVPVQLAEGPASSASVILLLLVGCTVEEARLVLLFLVPECETGFAGDVRLHVRASDEGVRGRVRRRLLIRRYVRLLVLVL